jgi:hypothetical protein
VFQKSIIENTVENNDEEEQQQLRQNRIAQEISELEYSFYKKGINMIIKNQEDYLS